MTKLRQQNRTSIMNTILMTQRRLNPALWGLVVMLGALALPSPAAEPQKKTCLLKHFTPLMAKFGARNHDQARVVSGPQPAKMLRNQAPGKVWQVALGEVRFKVTIEEQLSLDVSACLGRLEKLPPAYRRAFEIVSEGRKDGVAFYQNLDGAAAHGSQDYLNLVPKADARVIAHESGHILEQRATRSDPGTLDKWKEAVAADQISVSPYGDKVNHEDLAEFALVYALCLDAGKERLDELARLSPQRFRLWEKILNGGNSRNGGSKPAPF